MRAKAGGWGGAEEGIHPAWETYSRVDERWPGREAEEDERRGTETDREPAEESERKEGCDGREKALRRKGRHGNRNPGRKSPD